MKRSLALACLLAGGSAFAFVYEMQLNVSTTEAKEAAVRAAANYCEAEGKIAYRKPSKTKIRIVVWGDACGAGSGMVAWNETLKAQYAPDSEFAWDFLNRIGKDGKDAEGLFEASLNWETGNHAAYLYGGATGKVKGEDQLSLSGNFAGYMYAGQIVKSQTVRKCLYCGAVSVTVLDALGWGMCDCGEVDEKTVAHGTWTLKYNSSASKKYEESGDIAAAYKFPKYVLP